MAKSNAMRRLESILFDTGPEEYGPKLTRLNRKDEAYILGLVENNKGRFARKEILRLDKERIASKRRTRRPKGKTLDIVELRKRAYEKLHGTHKDKLKYNMLNTRKRVTRVMTANEADYAISASDAELTDSARDVPYVELDGVDINPFWYH